MARVSWINSEGQNAPVDQIGPINPEFGASERFHLSSMRHVRIATDNDLLAIHLDSRVLTSEVLNGLERRVLGWYRPGQKIYLYEIDCAFPQQHNSPWELFEYLSRAVFLGDMVNEVALTAKPVGFNRMFTENSPSILKQLRPVLEAWNINDADLDIGDSVGNVPLYNAISRCGLIGRIGVVALDPANEFRFRFLGRELDFISDRNKPSLKGLRMTEQPDRVFGNWAEQEYRRILASDRPSLDYCSGLIVSGENDDRPRNWIRLALPTRVPGQKRSRAIVGLTLATSSQSIVA